MNARGILGGSVRYHNPVDTFFLILLFGSRILGYWKQSGYYHVVNHILTLGLSEVQKSALHSLALGLLRCQKPSFWCILQRHPSLSFLFWSAQSLCHCGTLHRSQLWNKQQHKVISTTLCPHSYTSRSVFSTL